jgi:large subunit ribosomal protein L25
MIKGVQRNPITGQALHVDFFLVDLKHEMQSDVPLVVVGEAPAVELTGGMLLTSLDHLKIRALPADIPHEIQVDVSSLTDLDAAIHVRDLPHDEKVAILNDPDELVARVVPPRVEEEEVVPAEEAAQEEAEAAQAVPETEEQPADTPQEE